jgi:hypothetical protein
VTRDMLSITTQASVLNAKPKDVPNVVLITHTTAPNVLMAFNLIHPKDMKEGNINRSVLYVEKDIQLAVKPVKVQSIAIHVFKDLLCKIRNVK